MYDLGLLLRGDQAGGVSWNFPKNSTERVLVSDGKLMVCRLLQPEVSHTSVWF